ncbi:GlxA family transcriptional regulator [Dyadobacter psychrotolerans]|uniref:Helix-turn-helix domain-containing protein n=1 Tax=Dyadobacter psychrotolerans TaxID=2541721 RepID=A0A4R5DPF6_9BACT|nr:helix-turn-helix domain-containing protein [Dyadobacter psychrotolerans]TDE12835.1 helix-turn-helix domain-containing protein [Dyadobacter psychrotolerans]
MVKLALLITRKHRLLSVAAILDVFESVNRFYEIDGEQPFFEINLYDQEVEYISSYGSHKFKNFNDAVDPDLIFIPAFSSEDIFQAVIENAAFMPWLEKQYLRGAEIASFCTGAFLLAATGLLNGKTATTHINATIPFASAFPHVLLKADSVVTDDERLYTSGGATSSFHLMLYLIRNYCGKEMALRIAKMFAIDVDRNQQSYFGTFEPAQDHGDGLVNLAQKRIEKEYQEGSTIEKLIQDIPASRRNVVRRFKQATGVTPIEYLQKTRIEAAKKLLEQTDQSVLEVMLNSGYNDLKSFRQLFKKSAGLTPKEYRDKFNVARLAMGKRTAAINSI